MNQPRAQRYSLAILALIGLVVGSNLGAFVDQANGAAMDPRVVAAYRACGSCLDAVAGFAAEAMKVNRWLLTGAVAGLLLGVLVNWGLRLLRGAPVDLPRRVSSFRQSKEVARFSQEVGATLELQGILEQLHEEVTRVTSADCGSSFLFDLTSPEHRVALRVGEAADIHRLSPAEAAVVASARSQIVQDFEAEKLPPPHVGIRSALLVPITHEDNTIGLIHLHSQEPAKFDAEFHDLVQALAAQAAVAVLNAQRFDEQSRRTEALRQRVNQLQQLVQAPSAVRVDRPLVDNLEAIATAMQELADFRLIVISVYAASTNHLQHTVAKGNVPATFDRLTQPPTAWDRVQPYLREDYRNGRAFLVPHTQAPELLQALELSRSPARPEARVPGQWHADDVVLLPLYTSRGDIQGLLGVGAPREASTPQNLVLELLEFFAGQTALAIENAQMLAEAEARVGESQERAAQMTALTEAAGLIGAALRVEEVVTLTLDQLRRVIPYDAVTFWRRDPADGNWRVSGSRSYQEALERVIERMEHVKGALFSEISATRSVIFISDVTRDVRFQMRGASGLRSWLGVPLLSQGEVIGILSLEKGEDNFYLPGHVPLALAFASRAAVALENARLYEESVTRARALEEENARRLQELETRTQRLALLNRIAGEMNAAVDLGALLRLTLNALAEPLAVESASALVFDPDGPRDETFMMAAARHPADSEAGAGLTLANNALLERLEESGLPVVVEPERLPADSPVRPEHLAWIGAGVRAAVFLPLLAQGRLTGVVGIGYAAAARRFAPGDVELGFAIAQQAVTAIQNVQLRGKTREQAISGQLARSISRAADIPALWEIVRTQLTALVGTQSFTVALYDETRHEVHFPLIVEHGERLDGAAAAASGQAPSGLVRHILGTRQPLLLSGATEPYAQLLAVPGQHPVRGRWEGPAPTPGVSQAYLGVPLALGDRLLGVLIAEDAERAAAFDDSHERLLSATANQIALTLDNLRLYGLATTAAAASHERAAQLEALADVSLALATTLRTDEVIQRALDQLQRVLPHVAVTFWHKVPGSGQRQSAARWRAAGVRGYADTAERLGQTIEMEPGTALAEVAAGRGVLVIPNTGADARFSGPARAWLGLRVLNQGATSGLLEIEAAEAGVYTIAHGALAQAFAARLALALNEARQYEDSLARAQELDTQARRLTLLNRAAAELSGTLDLGKLLTTTLRLLSEGVGIRRAGAVVYEEGRATALAAAGWPAQPGADGDARALARGLTGNPLLARLRQMSGVESIPDLATDETVVPEHTTWLGGGAQSVTFLPLTAEGQTLGWVALGQREANKAPAPAELELAQVIVALAATAVQEALLYYRSQQRLSEQATINQISRAASQALDLTQLAEVLRAQFEAWLSPRRLQLALYDEARNELSFLLSIDQGQTQTPRAQAPVGLLRRVLQSEQPVLLASDLPAQLRELDLPADALGTASQYLAAPLRLGEKTVGVLALADPTRGDGLNESHERILIAVAAQVAIAIENARLYSDSLRHSHELEAENARRARQLAEQATLQQLSRGLSRSLDLKLVWDSLRLQMEAWLAPRSLRMALYDETRHEASFPLAVEEGRVLNLKPRSPEGVVRHVLRTEQPLLLTGDVPAQLLALDLPAEAVGQAGSYLAVPLRANERVLGVLTLADPGNGVELNDSHQRLLLALADQLAPVVDNARLHSLARLALLAAQARAGQMALVSEAAEVIGAAYRVDEAVDLTLGQLARLLPYARATYWQPVVLEGPSNQDEPARWQSVATRGANGADAAPLPASLAAELAGLRLPLLIAEAGRDARLGGEARAWLGLPLVSQDEVVGALVVESPTGQTYDNAELPALERFGRAAALALDAARRYEDSVRHGRAWEARAGLLEHLGIELNAALELETLLPVQLRLLAGALEAQVAGVLVFDDQATAGADPTQPKLMAHARFPLADDALPPAASAEALAGSLMVEWLPHADAPIAINDLASNRLITPAHLSWVGEGLKAVLFLPLIDAGRPIGLVGLGYPSARLAFTPAEIDLGQALAAQAAPVIKNALVYAGARRQLDEQNVLQQVLRAVSRAGDVWQLAEAVHSRLAAWLGADSLYLALYDEERDTVTFPVVVDNGQARAVEAQVPGGVLRHVLQNRHALRLSGDVALQARELGIPLSLNSHRPLRWSADSTEVLSAQSFLGMPILLGESVVGVLAIEAMQRAEAFDARHERILATIAAQVAVMLDNTRLYREAREALAAAQERVSQLETLTAALGVIATLLYSEDVINVALDQFQRVIPSDQIVYWRREPTAGRELRWRMAGANGPSEMGGGPDAVRQALFAEIVSSRRTLVVPDTSRDARFGPGVTGQGAGQAWLLVPLLNKGEVMGLLALEKDEANAYHIGHVPVAQILASQVAAVLTNAAEYEQSLQRVLELDERARRLAFLNRFAAEVGSGLDMRTTLQVTLRALAETLGIEQATVAVFDEAQNTVLALEHYPESKGAQALLAGFSLSGSFLRDRLRDTRAPIAVEDVTALEAGSRLRQADWIGRNVKAAMFLPLVQAGKLIGVVGLGQSEAGRRFTSNEMDLAMAMANQAAAAVQNVVLYDKTQQRLGEQATINQVNRALGRALDLAQLFAMVRGQLQDWVGPERLYLGLYDAQRNEVSFPLAIEAGQPVSLAPRVPTGLVRHLLHPVAQGQPPVRLNGEVAQQLKDQGLFVSGLGHSVGLDDLATVTACLGVPLAAGDKVVGLLLLASPTRVEAFDESHERILTALAPQIAVSIETTQQYDQARQAGAAAQARTAQLTALSEATSAVAAALRTDQVIALTLDQLQRVLPYDRVTFWRRVGSNGLWRVAAARRATPAAGGYVDAPERLGQTSELNAPQHDPLAEVYTTRSLMAVPDTAQDPRFEGNGARPGSWLGLPLVHKGEVQGLLALEKAETNTYTTGLMPLAQVFANQAAVALANVGLYEDSLQRAYELDERAALINRVSEALSASVDPDEILGIALAALAEAAPLAVASVIVFDEARPSGRARTTAHYPANRPAPTGGLPLTSNVLLNTLRETLRPVAVQSVATETLLQADHYEWVGAGLQAALFLPLVMARSVIGVIGLGQTEAARGFTTAEINLAMTVANQTAVAVHNARLYRQTQRRLMELAHISQTGRAIGQTVDVRQLYDSVRTQVEAALRAESLYLALYDATRDEVSFPLLVENGKALAVAPHRPDPLVRHILDTGRSLLLTGGVEQKLAELGLWPQGSTNAPPATLPLTAKAYLGVPLLLGDRVAGVLAVQDYKRTYGLTDKHERSLVSIAAPIAAAVDGARMYEASAQRALALDARSALLGRMAAELGDLPDLPRALAFIAQVLTETLAADVGAAIVFDDTAETLRALAAARYPDTGQGVATNSRSVTDSPVAQQLLSSLAPITLEELTHDVEEQRALTAWLAEGVQSALFVPLLTGDRLVGLAVVGQCQQARQFTAGEVELAQALANQAAVAVANVRQQQQMQPRLLALATISRVCQAAGAATTMAELAQAILTHVGTALEAETLYLALYDAARGELTFPLLYAAGETVTGTPQAPAGQLEYVLTQRASLALAGNVAEQLEKLGSRYVPVHPSLEPPQSWLGVPLMVSDRLVGLLAVEDRHEPDRFSPIHESILTTISGPVGVAIEHLRLQSEQVLNARALAERARELAVLNRMSAALIGATVAREVLTVALRELAASLNVTQAAAFIQTDGEALLHVRYPETVEAPAPGWLPEAVLGTLRETGNPVALLETGAGTALCLPLRRGQAMVGALVLPQRTPAFTPRDIELAATVANQAALAVENTRLLERWQQDSHTAQTHAARFDALTEAAQLITAAPGSKEVINQTLEQAARLLPYDTAAFWRWEPAAAADGPGQLQLLGLRGPEQAAERVGERLPLDQAGLLADVVNQGRVVIIADAVWEPRFRPEPNTTTRAWLGLPLLHRGELLGVLALARVEAEAYAAEIAPLAQTLGGFVAAAYANARQYEHSLDQINSLDTEARRLALLHRVQQDVFRTLPVQDVLERLLKELADTVGAEQAGALLFDHEQAQDHALLAQSPTPSETTTALIAGNALVERLRQNLGAFVLEDTGAAKLAAEHTAWIGTGIRAVLVLPLLIEQRWIGVVGLGVRHAPHHFAGPQVALAQDLARTLAVGVDHARAHHAVEQQLKDQHALNDLAASLGTVQAQDQLPASLTGWIKHMVGVDTLYLAVLDESRKTVSFPVLHEAGAARTVAPLAPAGVIQYILRGRQPLALTGDLVRELKTLNLPHKGQKAQREAGDPSSAKAYLGLPLLRGDQAVGVLALEKAQAEPFTEGQVRLLQAAAAQLWFTLERVRATAQELQSRHADLAALTARHTASTDRLRLVEQQFHDRQDSLRRLRGLTTALVRAQPQPAGSEALEGLLGQELLLASQALGADAGALYGLDGTAPAALPRASYGLNEQSPDEDQRALIMAALDRHETVLVEDLPTATASPDPAVDGDAPVTEPLMPTGNGYRSGLAVPLLSGDVALGGLLFLSRQPAAFGAAQIALANAAAAQVTYALQSEALSAAWHAQTGPLAQWLAENEPEPVDDLTAAVETTLTPPALVDRAPESVAPANTAFNVRPVAAASQPAVVEAAALVPAAGGRRRLPVAVVALALVVCLFGALAVSARPLGQALGLFGANATPTENSGPTAALVSTTSAPADTAVVQPTQTAANTATATLTAAPSKTPAPTDTPAPTKSPTPSLPPGVTALATVTLSEGIAGRLRDAPNGAVIGGVPGNSQVQVLQGRVTTDNGIVWVEIRAVETGQTGWFAESLLRYDTPPEG